MTYQHLGDIIKENSALGLSVGASVPTGDNFETVTALQASINGDAKFTLENTSSSASDPPSSSGGSWGLVIGLVIGIAAITGAVVFLKSRGRKNKTVPSPSAVGNSVTIINNPAPADNADKLRLEQERLRLEKEKFDLEKEKYARAQETSAVHECKYCGVKNESGTKYCAGCGAAL